MTKDGYRLLPRLLFLLSFWCMGTLINFLSFGISIAVFLCSLTVLIPKVKLPAISAIKVHAWLLAAFSSCVLAMACGTYDDAPSSLFILFLGLLSVPSTALTVFFILGLSSDAINSKPSSKASGQSGTSVKEIITILAGSTLVITLMSASSPLYPYNYWDDANIYFTIGRCIKHGLVLYRDAYDHKGPTVYFAHAAAAMISEKSFTGVWIIELIENFFFCFFAWKIVKLYIEPPFYMIMSVPALLSVLCCLSSFYFGDSAEEMCLPALAAILYLSLSYVKSEAPLPFSHAVAAGLLSAFIFWLKYTMCGLILGLAVFIVFDMLIRKEGKILLRTIGGVAAGLLAGSVPAVLYFAVNNALTDLLTAYFYNNIFYYTALVSNSTIPFINVPVLGTIIRMIHNLAWDTGRGIVGFLLIFVASAAISGGNRRLRLLFLLCFSFTAVGIYIGSTVLYYYCHLLMVFVPLALVPILLLLMKAEKAIRHKTRLSAVIVSSSFVIVFLMSILQSPNFFFMTTVSREDLPQYKFAQIMSRTESPVILTYDTLDIGLYTFTGTLPGNRYFSFTNLAESVPEVREEQHRLISEGYYDYILATSPDYNFEGYEVISYEHFQFLGIYKKLVADDFYLYARIDQQS